MPDFAPPARPSNPFAAPPFAPLLPHAPGPAPRLLGAGGNPAGAAELGAQFAEGSSTPASAAHTKLLEEAKLFSTDMVTKPTADLDPKVAAEQRITHARKIVLSLEALGLTPEQARAQSGMDDRILKEVGRQQELVDALMSQRSKLTAAQLEAAKLAAEQRARMREKPGSVSKAEHDALIEKMGGQKAIDELPAETRLLLHGFSPDEIADHFTARDKDADVLVDPEDPKGASNTEARGTGALADAKDGDRNDNAHSGDRGTVRRPMTPTEADMAIDMNCVLDESWHAGNRFGKLIPENTIGNLQTGRDTYRDSRGDARGTDPIGLTGDLAELANTTTSRSRDGTPPGPADQIANAGVDYVGSPFVERDERGRLVPRRHPDGTDAPVYRVEGTITPELEENAQVQVGHGVMARAQERSRALGAHRTNVNNAYIPKLLRSDPKGLLLGLAERFRKGPTDPRTGLGFSTTESADMGVIPNQERKMSSRIPFGRLPDARVTRSDHPGIPVLQQTDGGSRFATTSALAPTDRAKYATLRAASAQRASEVDEREAEERASRPVIPAQQTKGVS